MNRTILKEELKISFVIILSFCIIIALESLLHFDDYNETLKDNLKSPIGLIRFFPSTILLYLFIKEILLSSNQNRSLLNFSVLKEGIVFVQDFQLWLGIFETLSVRKIQTSELKQFKHLKRFSLETDKKETCVRVFLYSKSQKELEERIKMSKPILEVVLPDINLMLKDKITKLLGQSELLKLEKKIFLKESSELVFPQFVDSVESISPDFSRLILSCNLLEDGLMEEKTHWENYIQCYVLYSYDHDSFFKYINKFLHQKDKTEPLWDIKELQRIRLRYQTDNPIRANFTKGLILFKRGLSLLLPELTPFAIKKLKTDNSLTDIPIERKTIVLKNSKKETNSFSMNQICSELCNIPNDNKLNQDERTKKCHRRAGFCKRLLFNDNFSSILDNIRNQKYETDRVHLINELKRNISYQQLICVFVQLSQSNQNENSNHEIINIIKKLFQLKYEAHGPPITGKQLNSSMFSENKSTEQISSSSAQN